MNRKINMWWKVLVFLICIFLFYGCDYNSISETQRDYFTDSDGTRYYIVNNNHFTFEGYNILEVIVNDSEKFILYDTENDDGESGVGEWIKDGVSYPITFMDYDRNHLSGKHANIIITPNANYGNYWNTSDTKEIPPVIAMINNDTENPGLYRWSTGAQPYNLEFEAKKISVQYVTYTRNDLNDHSYIPQKAALFYSSNEENVSFASEDLNICFDGKTGIGFWTLNDTSIPIIASFDQNQFILSVYYNTKDERQGMIIFSATGTSVNDISDDHATFILNFFPQNLGYESNTTVLIKKQ